MRAPYVNLAFNHFLGIALALQSPFLLSGNFALRSPLGKNLFLMGLIAQILGFVLTRKMPALFQYAKSHFGIGPTLILFIDCVTALLTSYGYSALAAPFLFLLACFISGIYLLIAFRFGRDSQLDMRRLGALLLVFLLLTIEFYLVRSWLHPELKRITLFWGIQGVCLFFTDFKIDQILRPRFAFLTLSFVSLLAGNTHYYIVTSRQTASSGSYAMTFYSPFHEIKMIEQSDDTRASTGLLQHTLLRDGQPAFNSHIEQTDYHCLVSLPLLGAKPAPESALVVEGGTGLASRSLQNAVRLRRVDIFEPDRELVQLAKSELRLRMYNLDSFAMKNVYLKIQDGFSALAKSEDYYDLILLDLPASSVDTQARFHTVEFFNLAKKHLTKNGKISLRMGKCAEGDESSLRSFRVILGTLRESGFETQQIFRAQDRCFAIAASQQNSETKGDAVCQTLRTPPAETRFAQFLTNGRPLHQ